MMTVAGVSRDAKQRRSVLLIDYDSTSLSQRYKQCPGKQRAEVPKMKGLKTIEQLSPPTSLFTSHLL